MCLICFQVAPGHGDSPGMNGHKCQYCFTVISDHNQMVEHMRQHELRGMYMYSIESRIVYLWEKRREKKSFVPVYFDRKPHPLEISAPSPPPCLCYRIFTKFCRILTIYGILHYLYGILLQSYKNPAKSHKNGATASPY